MHSQIAKSLIEETGYVGRDEPDSDNDIGLTQAKIWGESKCYSRKRGNEKAIRLRQGRRARRICRLHTCRVQACEF
jgi:hypothetical protein